LAEAAKNDVNLAQIWHKKTSKVINSGSREGLWKHMGGAHAKSKEGLYSGRNCLEAYTMPNKEIKSRMMEIREFRGQNAFYLEYPNRDLLNRKYNKQKTVQKTIGRLFFYMFISSFYN